MGELGDRLDALERTAAPFDGRVQATIGDRGKRVDIRFEPGTSYGDERALARRISAALSAAGTAWLSEAREIIDAFVDGAIHDDAPEFGPERRQYRERLEQLMGRGTDPTESVSVRCGDLSRWEVTITPGTTRTMRESEFIAALKEALRVAIANRDLQVFQAQDEMFGLGLPPGSVDWEQLRANQSAEEEERHAR
jgi:hypothetical protein